MNVQKPELSQGESISYSITWSQGDKTYTNTCPANWQLQRARFLLLYICGWFSHIWGWLRVSCSQSWSISFIYLSAPCIYKCGQFFYTFEGPTGSSVGLNLSLNIRLVVLSILCVMRSADTFTSKMNLNIVFNSLDWYIPILAAIYWKSLVLVIPVMPITFSGLKITEVPCVFAQPTCRLKVRLLLFTKRRSGYGYRDTTPPQVTRAQGGLLNRAVRRHGVNKTPTIARQELTAIERNSPSAVGVRGIPVWVEPANRSSSW